MKDEKINKIEIVRTPLSSTVKLFANIISLGQFDKLIKKYSFDKLFHLSLYINGKYTLEKNAVIEFYKHNPVKSNSEVLDILIGNNNINIGKLIENTKKKMGDFKFTNYNPDTNNCQHFLLNILSANNIGNSDDVKFIKQDTEKVFNELPTFSNILGNLAVTAGAINDRLQYGEGILNKILYVIFMKNKFYYFKFIIY